MRPTTGQYVPLVYASDELGQLKEVSVVLGKGYTLPADAWRQATRDLTLAQREGLDVLPVVVRVGSRGEPQRFYLDKGSLPRRANRSAQRWHDGKDIAKELGLTLDELQQVLRNAFASGSAYAYADMDMLHSEDVAELRKAKKAGEDLREWAERRLTGSNAPRRSNPKGTLSDDDLTWLREHAEELRQARDEGGDEADWEPEIVMTSIGYVEVDADGVVTGFGRELANVLEGRIANPAQATGAQDVAKLALPESRDRLENGSPNPAAKKAASKKPAAKKAGPKKPAAKDKALSAAEAALKPLGWTVGELCKEVRKPKKAAPRQPRKTVREVVPVEAALEDTRGALQSMKLPPAVVDAAADLVTPERLRHPTAEAMVFVSDTGVVARHVPPSRTASDIMSEATRAFPELKDSAIFLIAPLLSQGNETEDMQRLQATQKSILARCANLIRISQMHKNQSQELLREALRQAGVSEQTRSDTMVEVDQALEQPEATHGAVGVFSDGSTIVGSSTAAKSRELREAIYNEGAALVIMLVPDTEVPKEAKTPAKSAWEKPTIKTRKTRAPKRKAPSVQAAEFAVVLPIEVARFRFAFMKIDPWPDESRFAYTPGGRGRPATGHKAWKRFTQELELQNYTDGPHGYGGLESPKGTPSPSTVANAKVLLEFYARAHGAFGFTETAGMQEAWEWVWWRIKHQFKDNVDGMGPKRAWEWFVQRWYTLIFGKRWQEPSTAVAPSPAETKAEADATADEARIEKLMSQFMAESAKTLRAELEKED